MLKVRSNVHLLRRIYHMVGASFIAFLYYVLPHDKMILLFTSFSILTITLDFVRLKSKALNQKLMAIMGGIARRNEVGGLTGMSFLCLGVMVIVIVFPKEIVTLSILMLAVGDPISSIFGILYGKDYLIGKKTLQGSIAGFLACTILSGIYYSVFGFMGERVVLAAIITGLIGAIAELLPIADLDDNFTFPVVSSCLLWILFQMMNG